MFAAPFRIRLQHCHFIGLHRIYRRRYNSFHRDVHIGLIGYSEKMKWPQHYTLNGDTNIEGEVKNMKFDEKKPTITLQVTVLFLGTENDHDHVTIARSKSSLSFRSCTNSLMLIKKKKKEKRTRGKYGWRNETDNVKISGKFNYTSNWRNEDFFARRSLTFSSLSCMKITWLAPRAFTRFVFSNEKLLLHPLLITDFPRCKTWKLDVHNGISFFFF